MKEKLNLKSIKNVLSRNEMKVIMGGSNNPNCNGSTGTSTWYCCGTAGSGQGTLIGSMSCNDASSHCPGGTLTNNPTRC